MRGDDPQAILLRSGWKCVKIRDKLGWLRIRGLRGAQGESTAVAVDLRNAIRQHVNRKPLRPVRLTCATNSKRRQPEEKSEVASSHTSNETQDQRPRARYACNAAYAHEGRH